ncbi:MAG: NHL repeat-containing protein [Candidatus Poribacteria bacterium]
MKASKIIGVILAIAIISAVVIIIYNARTTEKKTTIGDVFKYDLTEFTKTDPNLIKYKEVNKINIKLQNASAIAIDPNDRIYVAGDKLIRVFNDKGDVLSEIELPNNATCLTVANNGDIYVAIRDHIEIYNQKGKQISKWNSIGANAVITSIAVHNDNIFIADAVGKIVQRYDIKGKLINVIGKKNSDKGISGFVIPSPYFDLLVANDGLLRVVNPGNHKIETYSFDGELMFSWGKTSLEIDGFGGCCNPVNIAILSDGKFVTCEKGLPRVKIYSEKGDFIGVVAGAESFENTVGIHNPEICKEESAKVLDVAVDSKGRIFVLDPAEKTIRIFISKS